MMHSRRRSALDGRDRPGSVGADGVIARGAPARLHLLMEPADPILVDQSELVFTVVEPVDLRLSELVNELVDVDEAAADLHEDGLLAILALDAQLDENASLAELVDSLRDAEEHNLQPVLVTFRQVFRESLVGFVILAADVDLVASVFCFLLRHLVLQ